LRFVIPGIAHGINCGLLIKPGVLLDTKNSKHPAPVALLEVTARVVGVLISYIPLL